MSDVNQLTFRGSILKNCEICRPKKGGVYVRVHFASELTAPVIEAMKWKELPDCIEGGKLSGVIISPQKFILTPNDKALQDFEIELECAEVADFSIQRIENKNGQIRTELRFVVRTNQEGAESDVANWMRKIGGAEAALKVTYAGEIQPKLPMGEGQQEGDDEGEEAPPFAADSVIDGAKEAPIAQATVMGGTHQRKRGRPARNREAEAFADGSAERNCVDCANLIPFLDGDLSMHASGQPCAKML